MTGQKAHEAVMQGMNMTFRIVTTGGPGLIGGEDAGHACAIEASNSLARPFYKVQIFEFAYIPGLDIDGPVSVKKNNRS